MTKARENIFRGSHGFNYLEDAGQGEVGLNTKTERAANVCLQHAMVGVQFELRLARYARSSEEFPAEGEGDLTADPSLGTFSQPSADPETLAAFPVRDTRRLGIPTSFRVPPDRF